MNVKVLVISIACLGMLSSLGTVVAQTTWYVDASVVGPGNGTQTSPFKLIQAGINAASNGDTVLVLPGSYFEHSISFQGKAITVTSSQGPEVTIVDGQYANSVVIFQSNEGPGSVLDGLTLTHGRGPDTLGRAGGIHVAGASPTIRRCIIAENTGSQGDTWASPTRGAAGGLGVGSRDLPQPPAPSNPVLEHCILRGNIGGAGGYGRWAVCLMTKWPAVPGAPGGAGAIETAAAYPWSSSTLVLVNCLVVDNSGGPGGSGGDGWGICGPGTMDGKDGGDGGPGGLENYASSVYMMGVTMAGNTGGAGGAGGAGNGGAPGSNGAAGAGAVSNLAGVVAGGNLIIWGNQPATGFVPSVLYSLLWTAVGGIGNITGDPLFVDPTNGDYHILPTSPCVDAGDINAFLLPAFDIDGDPRIFHGAPDMGADETVLTLLWEQAGGPGTPLTLTNYNLATGHEYHNIFSLDLCPGGPGSGPYLGMCLTTMANYLFIVDQLQAPLGTPLFHFSAQQSYAIWGPYPIPPITVDGILYDFTGGVIGSFSPVTRIVVQ